MTFCVALGQVTLDDLSWQVASTAFASGLGFGLIVRARSFWGVIRRIIVAQRLSIILATVLHRLDEVECKLSCCHRFGLGAIGLAFEPPDLGFESRILATQAFKMLASLADQLYVRFVTAFSSRPLSAVSSLSVPQYFLPAK
ncbi:MAG: hypothetical protein GY811_07345 [Myxococcales bacterium]|nr:hypothetical protein [Myxococcales bacterium]